MIQAKRFHEDNVFTTYYFGNAIVGRLFHTHHPTIPYEVFAYSLPETVGRGGESIKSKRVYSEDEAEQFVNQFLSEKNQ